jgi:hypothetical protein
MLGLLKTKLREAVDRRVMHLMQQHVGRLAQQQMAGELESLQAEVARLRAERDEAEARFRRSPDLPDTDGATLIYGHASHFQEIAELARAAGHRLIYVLAPHHSDRPPSGLPVIPLDSVPWGAAGAVIALDAPERGEEGSFAANLARLAPLVPAAVPILHPAALAFAPGVARSGHWAVTGFPGSGNILAHAILRALQGDDDLPAGLARHLGDAQALSLRQLVYACFGALPGFACNIGPGLAAPHRAWVAVHWDRGWFVLDGLPYAGWLERPIGTHADWTPDNQAAIEALGYRSFAVLRHPLDAIQSMLAKLGRKGLDAFAGGPMLERAAQRHRTALEATLRPDARLALIRFEALLADPVAEITRLGTLLGRAVSPDRAAALRDALLFRDLVGGPAPHLRDPLGKAGRGFSDAALALLERRGTRAIAERLGYAWPERGASAPLDLPALEGTALLLAPLDLLAEASCQPPELPGVTLHAASAAVLDMVRALAGVSLLPRFCRSLAAPGRAAARQATRRAPAPG